MSEQSAPDPDPRPVVRLRPKVDARPIRHGFPWIYADQVVTDRRTRGLAPGTVALLEDNARTALGVVTVNPNSKIIARMLDRDCAAQIDAEWIAARLTRAEALRSRLFETPYYRLVHAEADGLPGVVIDRFGDALAIQPNTAWAEASLDTLIDVACQVTGANAVVKNGGGRARALEGLDDTVSVLAGKVDGPVPVVMNGATYMADLVGGQKTGLFYDQRPNHAFAARLAKGRRVLDVFTHVGGFGLAALAHGAASALAVDASAPALDLAQAGADATGVADRFSIQKGDAFAVMEALAEDRAKFDLVICDPPAFAPAKSAQAAGLRAYERVARLAAGLVAPGGDLILCSCSYAVDLAAFRAACARGIGRAGRAAAMIYTGFAGPDHPQLPQLPETGYLKALAYRLDG